MKTLYLHIGSHKCASTSIQRSLRISKNVLAKNGFSYFHENINGEPKFNANSWLEYKPEYFAKGKGAKVRQVEKLFEKAAACDRNVIVSSENFSWIFEGDQVGKIYNAARRHFDNVKIIVYIRRQDKIAVSHHQQGSRTRDGFILPASFLYGHGNRALPENSAMVSKYLDYNEKISLWTSYFGKESLVIRIFEEDQLIGNDPVVDFYDILNINKGFKKLRINQSKGFEATKIGHLLIENGLSDGIFPQMIFRKCSDSGKSLPSQADARNFYDFYRESNIQLNNIFNITQTNPAVFNDDFSSYPETPEDIWNEDSANAAISHILTALKPLAQLRPSDLSLALLSMEESDPDERKRLEKILKYLEKFERAKYVTEKETFFDKIIRLHETVADSVKSLFISKKEKVSEKEDAPALPSDFDESTYLKLNKDVADSKVDPAEHYLNHGIAEGRRYRTSWIERKDES